MKKNEKRNEYEKKRKGGVDGYKQGRENDRKEEREIWKKIKRMA